MDAAREAFYRSLQSGWEKKRQEALLKAEASQVPASAYEARLAADRGLDLAKAFSKGASQMGTLGGKQAGDGGFSALADDLQSSGATDLALKEKVLAASELAADRAHKGLMDVNSGYLDERKLAQAGELNRAKLDAASGKTKTAIAQTGDGVYLVDSETGRKISRLGSSPTAVASQERRDDKATAVSEKRQEAADLLTVPGFERVGDVKIRPEEAGKARDMTGKMNALQKELDNLEGLQKRYGNFEYGGAGGGAMAASSNNARMLIKDLYELGALTGPDLGTLQAMVPMPDTREALLTREATATGTLSQSKNSLRGNFLSSMEAKGYKPKINNDAPGNGTKETATPWISEGDGSAMASPVEKKTDGRRFKYSEKLNRTRVLDAAGKVVEEYDGRPR